MRSRIGSVMRDKKLVLLFLVLLAFALRVYRLDGPALRGDEAFSIILARNRLGEMLGQFTAATEPHPPLSFVLLHGWARLAGESEFALRMTSVWAGVCVVPLIYVLGRTLWDDRVGLLAAAMTAVNPFYIWHAQEARMYALLVAFSLASVFSFLMLLRRRAWGWWVAYGLLTALSVYTHYYAFLVVAFQGLYALLDLAFGRGRSTDLPGRLRPLARWAAGLALAGTLYLPWFLSSWQVLTAYHGSARSDLPFLEPAYKSLLVFGQGQTLPQRTALWFLPLWGGLFLGGWAVAWRRDRRSAAFTLLHWLIPWTAVYVDSLQRPAFDERYFMVSSPPYHLFVALSLAALYRRRRSSRVARWLLWAIVALIVGISGLALHHHYHDPAYARAPDWRAARDFFVRRVGEGDVVIVNLPDPAARYYHDFDVPWMVLPESYPVDPGATSARLEELARAHPRIWLMPQRWPTWDVEGQVERWLDAQTERVIEQRVDRFRIVLYHTPRRFREEMRPLDARLQGGIRLLGYVLRDGEGRAVDRLEVSPGETVRLTLYWQAESQIERDYTVFAHLLDPTGWLRGQQDHPPRGGTWPTTAWQPEAMVVDLYRIVAAAESPPGDYSREVGMYRHEDGARLPARGEDADPAHDRVLLRDLVRVR